jgi:MSHA biogenesis protein MshJ
MFSRLDEQFAALSLREKYLILLVGVALIGLGGFTFLIEPQIKANQRTGLELANKTIELRSVDEQMILIQTALADDPNADVNRRIEALNNRIEALDLEFATQMRELVPAQQMPAVIEQMLAQADRLKLLELTSIPPISVFSGDSENADLPLYQHGVKFVYEGSYTDILRYIEQAEGLPWQLYWRSLDYEVNEYPTATIELELFTLSTSRAFMGVQ